MNSRKNSAVSERIAAQQQLCNTSIISSAIATIMMLVSAFLKYDGFLGIQVYYGLCCVLLIRNIVVTNYYHKAFNHIAYLLKSGILQEEEARQHLINDINYTFKNSMIRSMQLVKWSFTDHFPQPVFKRLHRTTR